MTSVEVLIRMPVSEAERIREILSILLLDGVGALNPNQQNTIMLFHGALPTGVESNEVDK
jgi:hypothetical protein